MLQSHTWVKESFKVEDRLMDFKVTVRKVHQYGFRIHIATNPWETTTCGDLVNSPRRISKMIYENYPPFSNYIWQDFHMKGANTIWHQHQISLCFWQRKERTSEFREIIHASEPISRNLHPLPLLYWAFALVRGRPAQGHVPFLNLGLLRECAFLANASHGAVWDQ